MDSKEHILQAIRQNTRRKYEMPDLSDIEKEAIVYPDQISQFCDIMSQVGGRAIVLQPQDELDSIIHRLYPDARRIATVTDTFTVNGRTLQAGCATYHPDEAASSGELDGTDVAILQGQYGVCENGAVWIEQDVEQRAIYFISEALVIILDRHKLVNNMHEAYRCIDTGKYGYGVFISGPSKTADIEQALVMGAHGARDVTVILV